MYKISNKRLRRWEANSKSINFYVAHIYGNAALLLFYVQGGTKLALLATMKLARHEED